ncbi:MAG: hypothetical protein NTY64_14765, partial [Deltaproteobacteria bacterium]|nr:hypothetical protein [Deltaproteobacteria bacterium]
MGVAFPIFVYGLWAFILLSPMADNEHLPKAWDHANHLAHIIEASSALKEGQFPIRIAPWQH